MTTLNPDSGPWADCGCGDITQGAGARVVFVFLSYAEEDREIAAGISAWLGEQGVDRFDWLTTGSGRFLSQIEGAISRADAFLALMSPNFMASKWCSRERDIALLREQQLQEDDPSRAFVHVLEVGSIRPDAAGFLGAYNWVRFATPAALDDAFDELTRRLGLGRGAAPAAAARPPGAQAPGAGAAQSRAAALPSFRNRDSEFDLIDAALIATGEKPFWLVTAPPQLGKTWLLRQIRNKLESLPPPGWTVSMIDVRNLPPSLRQDPGALIAKLFRQNTPVPGTNDALRTVTREVLRGGRPWLCLLDHAELLDKTVAAEFRSRISQIYQEVLNAMRDNVRVGLIVASRREAEWLGVTPSPRMTRLPLSEFRPEVIQAALLQLAGEIRRRYSEAEAERDTELVYELTQGLPALLAACLEWIQEDGWLDLQELRTPEIFKRLAYPYIDSELLTKDSLLPRRDMALAAGNRAAAELSAVREAYRVLAPFRLFTRSHMHHYLDSDEVFRTAVTSSQWTAEDLWTAISDTALLNRLRGLWKVIHPAVRRLLYRYYYPSDEACSLVHEKARNIVWDWAVRRQGIEQADFVVECLWHEAMALRTGPPSVLRTRLTGSAGTLSRHLLGSDSYSDDDLREYAADKMGDDAELQQATGSAPELFHRLIEIVRNPFQETPHPPPEEPA